MKNINKRWTRGQWQYRHFMYHMANVSKTAMTKSICRRYGANSSQGVGPIELKLSGGHQDMWQNTYL